MHTYLLRRMAVFVISLVGASVLGAQLAYAHCDTLDGPVVADARQALSAGDVTAVLKWIKPEHEQDIRSAFTQALGVRALGPQAQQLADSYFFETLERVHRTGEGAPYTGLKPAGTQLSPAVAGADAALDHGSLDALETLVLGAVRDGMRERFATVLAAKPHAADSVTAGREYVEAYVQFVHYVERLADDAASSPEEHSGGGEEAAAHSAHGH